MSKLKKVFYFLLVVLIIIQFFRPTRNVGISWLDTDITHSVTVPVEVKNILEKSCFDCHSNNTNYPWYTNVQPIGWWLNHHVEEGKREINFSIFETYKLKRKIHKLKEIKEQIEEGEMPMSSYTLIHSDATLSDTDKALVLEWVKTSLLGLTDTLPHQP